MKAIRGLLFAVIVMGILAGSSTGKKPLSEKNQNTEIVVEGSNKFALELYEKLRTIEGNDQMFFAVNLFSWTFKDDSSGKNVTFPSKGVHVWKRQQDNSWKILLDLYNLSVTVSQ